MVLAPRSFASRHAQWRVLTVESLEDRRLLDAGLPSAITPAIPTPWHNAARPLDVNNDGLFSPSDALAIINRMLNQGTGPLPADPPSRTSTTTPTATTCCRRATWCGSSMGCCAPTEVELDTLMPFTIDLTPRLKVTVASAAGVADGTPVHLDVDLNNDGDFVGAGEARLHDHAGMYDGRPSSPWPRACRQ